MELTQELIAFVAKEVNGTTVLPSGEKDENGNPIPRLDPQGNPIDFAKWERLTMVEAIIKHWPHELGVVATSQHFVSVEELNKLIYASVLTCEDLHSLVTVREEELNSEFVDLESHKKLRALYDSQGRQTRNSILSLSTL